MKLILEVEILIPDTDDCPTAQVRVLSSDNLAVLIGNRRAIIPTGDNTDQIETDLDDLKSSFRLSLIALALFSPVAMPVLCFLAWLYVTGSIREMTVAEIWVWVAPLYAMTAALMIVGTPVIEWGVIRLYRLVCGEHRRE